jgi:hypothetical protein
MESDRVHTYRGITVSMVTLNMFLELEGKKDAHAGILLRIVRSNRRSTLTDATATFNNRAILNYSIRRRFFYSAFKRRPMSKKVTISRKVNWSVENDWAKITFRDETKVEIDTDKKVHKLLGYVLRLYYLLWNRDSNPS